MTDTTDPDDGRGLRIAIIGTEWYPELIERLINPARARLQELGVEPAWITTVHVPGSFELPIMAKTMAERGTYDAVIVFGVLIRGETSHYDHVADACAHGVMRAGLDTHVPVVFGVLTVESYDQAQARAGGAHSDKGRDCADAAVHMARLTKAYH
jgi:6,7-dimethyl-8-ribityllumazine synthase